MNMETFIHLRSPVGDLTIMENGEAITHLLFGAQNDGPCEPSPLLIEAARQLEAYFARRLRRFDLPLSPTGTAFQMRVWEALRTIPYGETRSYADIAALVGSPRGMRAVGLANGKNPISIIIPCHRVIGKNGALVGYGGGLPIKAALLALEQSP